VVKGSNEDVFRTIGELDLSLTQIKLLHVLDSGERAHSVKHLAELLHVSLPAMSRSVDGLHHRGLVTREEDPTDRRSKLVAATDRGRAIVTAMNDARMEKLREFIASLPDDQAARLAEALAPIAARDDLSNCRPNDDKDPDR